MLAIIVGVVGALIALGLTIVSIYVGVLSRQFYLPTPSFGHFLSILIPLFTYLGLSLPNLVSRPFVLARHQSTILSLLSILDATLITLASTLLQPNLRTCQLEQRWRSLFQAHNADAIRNIQDAFACCGLRTVLDQAWPFPDKAGAMACRDNFQRQRSCEAPWMAKEVRILSLWITVAAAALVVKAMFVVGRRNRPDWFGENHYSVRSYHRPYQQGSIDDIPGTENPGRQSYSDQPNEETRLRLPDSTR